MNTSNVINRFSSAGKKIILAGFALGLLVGVGAPGISAKTAEAACYGSTYVSGYIKSNGTYVAGHYRTCPDRSVYNNYSYPGNYNPNTGRISSGSRSSYTKLYSSSYSSPRSYSSNRSSYGSSYSSGYGSKSRSSLGGFFSRFGW